MFNLFEFFVNWNYKRKLKNSIQTTAVFTGKREYAVTKLRYGFRREDYFSYEIEYEVDGETRHGFYTFHPLPDPDIDEIKGKRIEIIYNKRKPYIFEAAFDDEEYFS